MKFDQSGEEFLVNIDDQVMDYLVRSANCAQTSFLLLQEAFDLPGGPMIKALTPFPGVALRGETCGVVTGCMMALGLVFGRDQIDDWAGFRTCLRRVRKFAFRFEDAVGSMNCIEILESQLGRPFNLADPLEALEYVAAGGRESCAQVVSTGVRLATELILEEYNPAAAEQMTAIEKNLD